MTRRLPPALTVAATAALAAWAGFPVALLALHASATHTSWTGANGLIGADGVLGADQLQDLAWARDVSVHGLAADLFTLGRTGHSYLEPASGIVGGLRALGVALPVGTILVTALAVVALAAGVSAWTARLFPGAPRAALAATTLALFTVTPAAALVNWLQLGRPRFRFDVYLTGDELLAATKLWGYAPAALALALLPVCVLCLERGLQSSGRRWTALASLAALGCAWSHPWQGITLVLILLGLLLLRLCLGRGDGRAAQWPRLLPVLAAALLPLVYYLVLARTDPAWRLADHNEQGARLPLLVLLACLGPPLLLATPGVRRPGGAPAEQALLLWVPAALLTYAVNGAFASHALQGIMIPLAVLIVRGAGRIRLPAVAGGLCVVLLTIPGLAYDARKFVRTSESGLVQYALPHDDAAALAWIAMRAPAGGVLAPTPFAALVPAFTDRAVWVGHGEWSPEYRRRARVADRLFDGRMRSPSAARGFVRASGARIVLTDCAHAGAQARLGRALVPVLAVTRRFGCARIYVLTPPGRRPRR